MSTLTGTTEQRWSLDSIYSGLSGEDYLADKQALAASLVEAEVLASDSAFAARDPHGWLESCIEKLDRLSALNSTLFCYAYASFSVDTRNEKAITELNQIEEIAVPMQAVIALFRQTLAKNKAALDLSTLSGALHEYRFFIEENILLAAHTMSAAEERLAADLSRSGSEAFFRLHEALSSNIKSDWGASEVKTIVDLRGMAYDPDRAIRRRAYESELAAWEKFKVPLAASLNGVKGTALTLAKRRNWSSPLEYSTAQSRISKTALDSIVSAVRTALPDFRRYMKAKAKILGLEKLAFYDLFAPVGAATNEEWSLSRAKEYIIERFGTFSTRLADFAKMAFSRQWIDSEPRDGKVGGGFCVHFPLAGEARVLTNFSGNFSSVLTLGHELGHAWHSWLLRNTPYVLRDYPLTLAETASIFCEKIISSEALKSASDSQKLGLLENWLSYSGQIIVDVLSRFDFESAMFEKREQGELSADELCELMLKAQRDNYGDALDAENMHPYMWAAKRQYYRADLNFYNYPYAFGQLFALGLYRIYEQEPDNFPERYMSLLIKSGSADAVTLCREQSIDIESRDFWDSAMDLLRADIDQFCLLATTPRSTK